MLAAPRAVAAEELKSTGKFTVPGLATVKVKAKMASRVTVVAEMIRKMVKVMAKARSLLSQKMMLKLSQMN